MKPKKSSDAALTDEEEDDIESQDVSKTGFDPYEEMIRKWTSMGIPQKEIVFINDAKGSKQRQAIFEKVNSGEIRIIVGSRPKLGVGVNIQKRLIAAHQLDTPWRPGDLTQSEGRIMRPGNENKEVQIIRYVSKGSFDVYMWQTLESKAHALELLLSGHENEENIIRVDSGEFEMTKAEAADNPLLMEKMATDAEVRRLQALKRGYMVRKADEESFMSKYKSAYDKAKAENKPIPSVADLLSKFDIICIDDFMASRLNPLFEFCFADSFSLLDQSSCTKLID